MTAIARVMVAPLRAPTASTRRRRAKPPAIGFVSLGCAKALVDSERILTRLKAEGYAIAPSYEGADLVVVNTCGFLLSARAESLDAIGEALAENGRVIVTGCLGAEPERIKAAHPEVLAVTGPHQTEAVLEAIHAHLPPPHEPFLELVPRHGLKLTPRHYAYLKISEGCRNRCSFCIIPKLRGDLVSRPLPEIMAEAEAMVEAGVKEILVVSQDTAAYGLDRRYERTSWRGEALETRFLDLCRALGRLGMWIRLHYVYPYPHVDAVVPLMAEGVILPYLDIPFQHASPRILAAMRRPADSERMLERIRSWRRVCPELAIRSTFITGFPGETEADFAELLAFLEEARLDRAGCFVYEPIEGAAANLLPDPVPEALAEERRARLMELQERISAERLREKIGRIEPVLIDRCDEEGRTIGRTRFDAPEVDGIVVVEHTEALPAGTILPVRITAAGSHDLIGEPAAAS
ncbi:MAG: 30S ribosomal protein S12 methylthiotransferase RimO [Geminicoccaceae bacterium]|nr:30S ribosomal protein S12 methylthiotransferase RimO [Geminicoccaceae bacterium]